MAQYMFGAGMMIAIPKKEIATPRILGTMQEVSIEFSGSTKELFGQNQFSAAAARGQQKITGKAKMAKIDMNTYNDLYFNEEMQVGQNLAVFNKECIVENTGATVTPAFGSGETFIENLGVTNYAGETLERVKDTPKVNEYTVDEKTGKYTFNDALKKKPVYISYLYQTTAGGKRIVINNALMGEAPTFKGIFNGRFAGKQMTLILNACTSSKLSLVSTKLEDFSIPEFDFAATADDANRVGELSTAE
nr:MAG TPA: hypothetical protein [Bacteriophage sp.]